MSGANLEAKTDNGETALHLAAASPHLLIVQFLVEHGANLKAKDIVDDSPLHLAVRGGKLGTVKYLVEMGEMFGTINDCKIVKQRHFTSDTIVR